MLMGREKVDKFEWRCSRGRRSSDSGPAARRFCSSKRRCEERHRPAQGRQAQQQHRNPGARRLLDRRAEPVRDFHRAGASQLEMDGKASSWPRSAKPSARRLHSFMATDKYIKENPGSSRAAPTRSPRREMDREKPATETWQKQSSRIFPGVNPKALVAAAERSQAENVEDHAEDRAERHGEVPGHPGARQRTRQRQAREIRNLVLTEFANKAK